MGCGEWHTLSGDDTVLDDLMSHSITYRIAVSAHQAHKAFTLLILPARANDRNARQVAYAAGFSLHAGIAGDADERLSVAGKRPMRIAHQPKMIYISLCSAISNASSTSIPG